MTGGAVVPLDNMPIMRVVYDREPLGDGAIITHESGVMGGEPWQPTADGCVVNRERGLRRGEQQGGADPITPH